MSKRSAIPYLPQLFWLAAVTIWLAWAPFRWKSSGSFDFEWWSGQDESLIHLLLLLPLMFGLRLVFGKLILFTPPRWIAFAGLAAIFAELPQGWIEQRGLSFDDAAANFIGAVTGIFLAGTMLRRKIPIWKSLHIAMAVTWVVITGFWLAEMGSLLSTFRIADWNANFHIVAGNEFNAPRRYLGEVLNARICAGFGEGEICAGQEADAESRLLLSRTAEASQQVTVSANVLSSSDHQFGPARIVTFSKGWNQRNVTLAQSGRSLVFRIRTAATGENGTGFEFHLPDAVRKGEPTLVRALFDRSIVTVSSSTPTREVQASFRPDFLGSLWTEGSDPLPGVLTGHGGPVAVALVFSGFPLSAASVIRSRKVLFSVSLLVLPFLHLLEVWLFDVPFIHLGTFIWLLAAVALGTGGALYSLRSHAAETATWPSRP